MLVYRYTGGGIVSARHISLLFVRVLSISLLLSRRRERRLTPSSYVRTSTVNRPRADLILVHCRRVPLLSWFPSFFFFFFPSPYFLSPRLPPNAVRRPVRQRDRVRRKVRVLVIGTSRHVNGQERKKKIIAKSSLCELSFSLPCVALTDKFLRARTQKRRSFLARKRLLQS